MAYFLAISLEGTGKKENEKRNVLKFDYTRILRRAENRRITHNDNWNK